MKVTLTSKLLAGAAFFLLGISPTDAAPRPKPFPTLPINAVIEMDGVRHEIGELGRLGFILSCSQVSPGLYNLKVEIENVGAEAIEWNNAPLAPGAVATWLDLTRQQEIVRHASTAYIFTLDELLVTHGAAFYPLELTMVPVGAHANDVVDPQYCQFGGTVTLIQANGLTE